MKFVFIEENREVHPVRIMCTALDVSASGYYRWRQRPVSVRERENRRLGVESRAVFRASRETYGRARMQRELRAQGIRCGQTRVARLMRQDGLRAKKARRFRQTTRAAASHAQQQPGAILERRAGVQGEGGQPLDAHLQAAFVERGAAVEQEVELGADDLLGAQVGFEAAEVEDGLAVGAVGEQAGDALDEVGAGGGEQGRGAGHGGGGDHAGGDAEAGARGAA